MTANGGLMQTEANGLMLNPVGDHLDLEPV